MRILGVGVDVVEVNRVQLILDRRSTFRERVFSSDEVAYCDRKAVPARYYAARWAAREACVKALGGVRGWRWHDIRVVRAPSGAPQMALSGPARERADRIGATDVLVSFSHEGTIATAFCIAVGE
jgi:holo-[acyl-carrier protein] synthase